MRRSTDLLGRDMVMRQVAESLAAGRSVLLYGPESIGKSAIVGALARNGIVVVDPFEHVTRQQASRMRRALDHGVVHLGATRAASRRALGAVGRILWRFSMIRVRELPDPVVARIVARELHRAIADLDPERRWLMKSSPSRSVGPVMRPPWRASPASGIDGTDTCRCRPSRLPRHARTQ